MNTATASRAAGTSITERLVTALTATWAAIQDRHPDVPDGLGYNPHKKPLMSGRKARQQHKLTEFTRSENRAG